jgi:methyl-accepting chemotaxis protein
MRIGFVARIAGSFLMGTLLFVGLVFVANRSLDRSGQGFEEFRRIATDSDRYTQLKLEMQTTRLAAEEFFTVRSMESRVSFEEHFVKANVLIQQGLADTLAVLDKELLESIRSAGTGFYLAFQQTVILGSVQDALMTDVLLPTASGRSDVQGLLDSYRSRPSLELAKVVRSRMTGGGRTPVALDSLILLESQIDQVVTDGLDRYGHLTGQLCDSAVGLIRSTQEELGATTSGSIADSRSLMARLGWAAAIMAALCGLFSILGLTRPLRQLTAATRALRAGRLDAKVPDRENTELGDLGRDLADVQRFLDGLLQELRDLALDCQAGYLRRRTKVEGLQGEWRGLAESVNTLLDVLVGHFDTVPQAILIMGPELEIRYTNPAAGELCQRPAGELQGKMCHSLLKLGDCRSARCGLAQAFKDGKSHASTCCASPAAGKREVNTFTRPLLDDKGHVIAAMEIITDQTELLGSRHHNEAASTYQQQEVQALSGLLEQLATGDLTVRYHTQETTEDLGEVHHSFRLIADSLNAAISGLQESFVSLREHATDIATSAHGLADTAGHLAEGADGIRQQSASVAGTTSGISTTVQQISETAGSISSDMEHVAGSVEDLYTSVHAILEQSREGAQVAGDARRLTDDARQTMLGLGGAAEEIGQVTDIIKRIASQTNLLSLNATIEAVSAGEAGAGFKVVASEIKSLAQQSATAAEDIARRIGLVQNNSRTAIEVMEQVSGIVVRIARLVDTISVSMNTQDTTTRELAGAVARVTEGSRRIAGSIADTARGTTEVSERIRSVSEESEAGSAAADSVRGTSAELDRIALELEELLAGFHIEE